MKWQLSAEQLYQLDSIEALVRHMRDYERQCGEYEFLELLDRLHLMMTAGGWYLQDDEAATPEQQAAAIERLQGYGGERTIQEEAEDRNLEPFPKVYEELQELQEGKGSVT